MLNIKLILSIFAVFLTFIGYFPYIKDIFKGKTKPHIFSWFIWSVTTSIIYALQITAGAGSGAWVTLCLIFIMLFIVLLGFKNGNKNIKKIDVLFLFLALSALPIWFFVKQPIFSIILLCFVDILGFIPTVRKSWNDPYSETLSLYTITTFRHGLSFFALAKYNIVTYLFPVTWIFVNAFFSIILIVRRMKINKINEKEF